MAPELFIGLTGVFVTTAVVSGWLAYGWLNARAPERLRLKQALADFLAQYEG